MRSMAHKHVRDGLRYPSMPVDVSVILHSGWNSLNRQRKNVSKEYTEDEFVGPCDYSLCSP